MLMHFYPMELFSYSYIIVCGYLKIIDGDFYEFLGRSLCGTVCFGNPVVANFSVATFNVAGTYGSLNFLS
jgi:hypothetical protein